jgi:methionine-rich copper-binding protein CopC
MSVHRGASRSGGRILAAPARVAAAFVAALLAGAAFAHAMLDKAVPAVGGRVAASPPRVELVFTERLEPAFSSVQVLDASGHRVDRGDSTVDAKERRRMAVSLPALAPGRYKVTWRAVSVDTHVTSGDYVFDIGP